MFQPSWAPLAPVCGFPSISGTAERLPFKDAHILNVLIHSLGDFHIETYSFNGEQFH